MANSPDYTPPKIWLWNKESGGRFASINRPIAGPTHEKELPVGRHPLQLYSLATPNGVKVTVMLEELLALKMSGAEYDAWLIRISEGDQFGSGFVAVNPNSKIAALRHPSEFLNPARFCCTSPRNLAPSCPLTLRRVPSACPGCSGRWAAPLTWAAGLVTSTPTHRRRSNMSSIALPWNRI